MGSNNINLFKSTKDLERNEGIINTNEKNKYFLKNVELIIKNTPYKNGTKKTKRIGGLKENFNRFSCGVKKVEGAICLTALKIAYLDK